MEKTFTHEGTEVIILEGKRLKKEKLISRLDKMNVNYIEENPKQYYIDLYDRAIANDKNKKKIINELREDTKNLRSSNKYKTTIENNKRNNSLDDEETVESPFNKKNEMSQKQLIKSEITNNRNLRTLNKYNNRIDNSNQNNKNDFTNILANQIKKNVKNSSLNAFELDRRRKEHYKQLNFEENMSNRNYDTETNLKNRPNINSNPYKGSYIKNTSVENNSGKVINLKNNFFENYNRTNFDNGKQKYNLSSIFPESNINMSNIINNDEKNISVNNCNRNYFSLDDPFNKEEKKEDLKNKKYNNITYDRNYDNNNQSDINMSKIYKLERKNDFMKFPQDTEDKKNYLSIPVNSSNNNSKKNNKYSRRKLQTINEENLMEEDEEEQDNNSDYQNNKNNIDLLLYILLLIIGFFLIYYVLKVIFRLGNTFTQAVTQTVQVVTNPRRLLRDLIFGLIKSILMGIFLEYAYATIPMIIISFLIYKYKQKRDFKKLCQQIIEEIKKDLENSANKSMSENEIINKYSKKYNIDKNIFLKKYLKELYKLRQDDHCLKLTQTINEKGENITSWELIH